MTKKRKNVSKVFKQNEQTRKRRERNRVLNEKKNEKKGKFLLFDSKEQTEND